MESFIEKEEEIYKLERLEVLVPQRVNGDNIFDREKFDVKTWRDGDKKMIFLRKKLAKQNDEQN